MKRCVVKIDRNMMCYIMQLPPGAEVRSMFFDMQADQLLVAIDGIGEERHPAEQLPEVEPILTNVNATCWNWNV